MKGLLKFITCGSVDDGKSTLIGHILYDAKLLYTDQEKALELDSKVGSREGAMDYSLLLDGLMAEREQGITIDVAYRYFTTDHRSFIVADTPGHEEYTRNMAVGASFAQLAIILLDVKQGVLVQTRRHARICSLMGIKHFVFAINKMDLEQYRKEPYEAIVEEIQTLKEELGLQNVVTIPISATEGDNVTTKSENMPWYVGDALLPYLEKVDVSLEEEEEGCYLPVQRVCRPNHTFRGFQGQMESGSLAVGEEVLILPSNEKAVVKSILVTNREETEAFQGQPVSIQLNREVDISRGCVIVKDTKVTTSNCFTATLLWMDDQPLIVGSEYLVKIGTKRLMGMVSSIEYKINVNDGSKENTSHLQKNEIALCQVTLLEKIVVDVFSHHKTLGELILIDRVSNMTAACGMVQEVLEEKVSRGTTSFYYEELKGYGELFEEYFYNIERHILQKGNALERSYTINDSLPLVGKGYRYPEYVDILMLADHLVVQVRDSVVRGMLPLRNYVYEGYPVISEQGFGIKVSSKEGLEEFLDDVYPLEEKEWELVLHKWMEFGTYRSVGFCRN